MKGIGMRQLVMDSVIEFFSGSKLEENFCTDALTIMSEYNTKWVNSTVTYDDPDGADELDEIIDNCVDEILALPQILM